MDPCFKTYSKIIAEWAKSEPLIIKAYIYGSRAKEYYKESSDLDVAIEITQLPHDSNMLSTWINEANMLRERLSTKFSKFPHIKLHLELLNDECITVFAGVRETGILIYQKQLV